MPCRRLFALAHTRTQADITYNFHALVRYIVQSLHFKISSFLLQLILDIIMSFYKYGMLSSSDLGHTCTLHYMDNSVAKKKIFFHSKQLTCHPLLSVLYVLCASFSGTYVMHTRLSAIYSLCLHTRKRLQWFLESDTVLFIIGLWVPTSTEGLMALKWPWHTGGTSKSVRSLNVLLL